MTTYKCTFEQNTSYCNKKNYLEDGLILWHVVPLGNIQRKFDQGKKMKIKKSSIPTYHKKNFGHETGNIQLFFFGLRWDE